MQRRTVTKFVTGLAAVGAMALVGCQEPASEEEAAVASQPLSAAGVPVLDFGSPKAIADEYIVMFKNDADSVAKGNAARAIQASGATLTKNFANLPGVAGRFSVKQLEALRKDPSVAYIEANKTLQAATIFPNPPPGLDRIDSRTNTNGQFNDFGFNGSGVHLFIFDTGIRTAHTEFTGRIGAGFSAINGDPSFQDCNGHGTHVASIAAGTKFGVAKGAIVHPVRILDCLGNGTTADLLEGVDFVLANGTRFPSIVNMSVFGPDSQAIRDAVDALATINVPTVVAAGNFNIDACTGSPANADAAITVAASNSANAPVRAAFSNFGFCVDLYAPGVGILGAGIANNNATSTRDGTSQAAPHVAGATALFMQRFPRTSTGKVTGSVNGNSTPGIVVGNPPDTNDQFLFVDFLVPAQQSCFGRCGGQSPDFSCACDQFCEFFGDCCRDVALQCTP